MTTVEVPPAADLPPAVRSKLVNWASTALGAFPSVQVPVSLARIARFAPAKRARTGAAVLLQALDNDQSFRAAVAQFVIEGGARAAGPVVIGQSGTSPVDSLAEAALAVLLRRPDAGDLIEGFQAARTSNSERSELDQAQAEIVRLRRVIESAATAGADATAGAKSGDKPGGKAGDKPGGKLSGSRSDSRTELDSTQLDRLRQRLRDQGVRIKNAEDAAAERERLLTERITALSAEVGRLAGELEQSRAKSAGETDRADRAQETVSRLRSEEHSERAHDHRRLELLLTTVEGGVAGLRRELALRGGGLDPAETVAAELTGRRPGGGRPAERTDEPQRLQSWLRLPAAHLIVDGYNVSKSGFGDLTLENQRDRLSRLLSGLAARTSVDITLVFDGATVIAPPPARRGVRVMFSPAGVLADDVIADLVAAEPTGRVVVVATTDAELVRRVSGRGARTTPSATLLSLLRN